MVLLNGKIIKEIDAVCENIVLYSISGSRVRCLVNKTRIRKSHASIPSTCLLLACNVSFQLKATVERGVTVSTHCSFYDFAISAMINTQRCTRNYT
jgi:hypothetical protein